MMKSPLNILIAEDDFFVKSEIANILNNLGHNVVYQATDGKDAVDKTVELRPDLVFMDIGMREIDGVEAATQIQEQSPTPIIFLTAYETEDMLQLASKAGACAYLTKPPNAAEIARAITISVARHQDLLTIRELNAKLQKTIKELEQSATEVKMLQDILPMCTMCKNIRDDEGYWHQVEKYIEQHTDTKFTHGICDTCIEKTYGQEYFAEYQKRKGKTKDR